MKKSLSQVRRLPLKCLGMLVIFSLGMQSFYSNDLWFLLATGREIIDNGIPYENPFALHDGMRIVVQQWLLASELYVVSDALACRGLPCRRACWVAYSMRCCHVGHVYSHRRRDGPQMRFVLCRVSGHHYLVHRQAQHGVGNHPSCRVVGS